ncbi:FecCD family ABC transporter permease [Pengzhenrongella sicca]|uniref:Iron ABC transporter permease n=1 Tax=Pengzhenrongella sicca TaxID=2819238 RepID=A0A8A4ZI26_9MICO|nr:iron ABC transporter permease [Pengzhenrongella sicca]QTE30629.1 iron ABC transporter permease [Pengzhenrongella sicca]
MTAPNPTAPRTLDRPSPGGGAPARRDRRRRGRGAVATSALVLAVLVAAIVGITVGSSSLTALDVTRTLLGSGSPGEELIVFDLRLPRVLGAVVVGGCLGMAGALTQTFARNPLATPDIIGVTSGAALGAVLAIVLAGGTYSVSARLLSLGVPAAATVGALVTAAVVYGLAWRGGVDSYRLILIGIGATATLGGITSYLIARAQITEAAAAAQWLVGSLSGVSWASVWPACLVLVVVAPVALAQSADLEVSRLGDEMTLGLGVRVQRHRLLVIACAVLLTAAAVSVSGPIEFVAFVAPQVARRLTRAGRPPLVASALAGALIVVAGDSVARLAPTEIPVGIVTAIVGAPYLIWLLTRRHGKENLA